MSSLKTSRWSEAKDRLALKGQLRRRRWGALGGEHQVTDPVTLSPVHRRYS